MRQLFLVLVLIAFGCTMSLAQQQAGQVLTPPTSQMNSAPISKTPAGFDLFRLLVSAPSVNQSQTDNQTTTPPQVIRQEEVFVVRGGAVYMPLLNGNILVGIPGGGASGCFSLYLPQRITALNEYLRKLQTVKQNDEVQY
jgi:hypothetical protein